MEVRSGDVKIKKESFRWRIFIYNVILLTMVAVVCTMYFLLNDTTIDNYNATFTTYHELNRFYNHVGDINRSYQNYLTTHKNRDLQAVLSLYKEGEQALQQVQDHLEQHDLANQFDDLKSMLVEYKDQLLPWKSDMDGSSQIAKTHELYLRIMKTRGDYYEIITDDMQLYKDQVNQNRTKLGWMSALLIIFMILWIIYFSSVMLRSITHPIETIIHNIHQIRKGEYDLTQLSNINEEMSVLCLALEDMAKSVQKNILNEQEKAELEKRVLEQENENLKKDELLAQGELRILQNQINPHFLFNTFNMIYKKAYSEGAIETSELMEKTAQLLRYSLDNTNKISTLKDELKAIENYMFIQEKRFGERIHFILDVDPTLTNIQMPTMILQPLVENAVQHGLKDTIEGGEIIVSAHRENHELVLSVADNGKGLSGEQLECLILNDYRMRDDEREHIGLYNVTKRLKAFYGKHVQIIINSEKACGFEMVIRIEGEGVWIC